MSVPFLRPSPFRGRWPWRGEDKSPFWDQRLFFSAAEYGGALGAGRTLASQSVLQALGWSNAQSTSNPPATVIGRDGNLQYAAHNLLAYSAGPRSTWSQNGSASDGGSGNPIDGFPTSRVVGISTGGYYKNSNTIIPSGQPFVIAHYVAHVSGNAVFCGGTESGSQAPLYFNTSTGAFTGGPEVKGARAVPGGWLIWGLYTGKGSVVAALNYAQGTDGTFDVVSWVTYGVRPLDYVPTASAAAYGIPTTYDRGASSNYAKDSADLSTANWTRSGTATADPPTLRSNGVVMSYISVGVPGNGVSRSYMIPGAAASAPMAGGLWLDPVSTSGKLYFQNSHNSDYGNWAIDLSKVSGPTWITRGHPAVTVNSEFSATPGGDCGLMVCADSGTKEAYVALSLQRGPVHTDAYLRTGSTAPLFTAGTPTRQNLASGDGTQSIAVVAGCVYTVLHQSGGTYTLSGAGSGTTSAGTATRVIATTGSLTLTASGSPTLLQVYEGTADMAYVAGPISEYPQAGILVAEGRTRETLQPRDLTQASWTKTNVTAAKTALGVTGAADSATTLTATAANGTVLQAITSASANRAFSAHVRSRSASNLIIDMTCDGGTTWQAVAVNAAYLRLAVTQATVTNPSYGFRLRANGDSIDVDFAQGEIGAFASPPIWGIESAAQARDVTQVNAPVSAINDTAQTTVVRAVPSKGVSGAVGAILARAGSGRAAYQLTTGAAGVHDSTNTASSVATLRDRVAAGIATRYSAAGIGVSLDGATPVTGSFDGSMGTSGSAVGLGHDGAGTSPFSGLITSLAISAKVATDAQLQDAARGSLP